MNVLEVEINFQLSYQQLRKLEREGYIHPKVLKVEKRRVYKDYDPKELKAIIDDRSRYVCMRYFEKRLGISANSLRKRLGQPGFPKTVEPENGLVNKDQRFYWFLKSDVDAFLNTDQVFKKGWMLPNKNQAEAA
jgi:DNA-binding transcriptional MerR regulator